MFQSKICRIKANCSTGSAEAAMAFYDFTCKLPGPKLTNQGRALWAARKTRPLGRAIQNGTRIAHVKAEGMAMEAIVIVGTVVGSFAGAFVLQKAALEGLFRMMNADRRTRH
jgi:hypothetical protein